jgi:hypothetical protein
MKTKDEKKKNEKEEIKELIIARLEVLPPNKKISIGSSGEFTVEDLIKEVKKETSIGEKITEIQIEFLKSLKEGIFYEQDTFDYETET